MASEVRTTKRKRKRSKKEEDYTDKLEREIRELKSINRSLMKQLKKLSKGIHKEEYESALEEVNRGKKKEESGRERECPECSRTGQLRTFEIAGRRFERCNHCGYKSGRLK